MDKRYYAPTIEEFHIGFRYEATTNAVLHEDESLNDWYKTTLDNTWELHNLGMYDHLRVKYLDQEDIEELGWRLDQCTNKDGCYYFMSDMKGRDWTLLIGGRELGYMGENYVALSCDKKYDSRSFCGQIKNYNELQKIMEQLNIIHDEK